MLPAGNAELPSAGPEELWVRPNYNLRQPGERSSGGNISPERGQRLLELADIALGVKKPAAGKKKNKILQSLKSPLCFVFSRLLLSPLRPFQFLLA